jgi:CMP-N-acetylneuraminic acid synthetase
LNNNSIAIIPIRSKNDKYYNLEINGETLLNIKIRQALNSTSVDKVIISCPDEEVKEIIDKHHIAHNKVVFQKRTQKLARINTSLNETIKEILVNEDYTQVNSVIILDLRFPLISTMKIDDAVNTMMLFKANSLISVRPDNNLYFKHDGTGMKPILGQESRSKLERDTLYKHVGGITVVDKTSFLKYGAILHGKVGHLILDKNSSYSVENTSDLTIVNEINKIYQLIS